MTASYLASSPVFRNKWLRYTIAWIALAGPALTAQPSAAARGSDKPAPGARALAFEVVSIRPSRPGGKMQGGVSDNGFSMYGQSLWSTIMSAHFPMKFWSNDRLQGAPPWVGKENYDIEAKFDEPTAKQFRNMTIAQRQEQVRPVLQALLAERCKLVLHTVPAETPAFALIVGKHGVNAKELKMTTPGQPIPPGLVNLSNGGFMEPGNGKLVFFQTPVASLADFLSHSSPRPLLDQSGLTGNYDFTLTRLEDTGASPNDPEPPTHWKVEDLGLAIKATKAPTVTLVIDHIERPSAN